MSGLRSERVNTAARGREMPSFKEGRRKKKYLIWRRSELSNVGLSLFHGTRNQAQTFGARWIRCKLRAREFCAVSLPCWRFSLQHTYSSIILMSQLLPGELRSFLGSTRWLLLPNRRLPQTYDIIPVNPQQHCDITGDSASVSYRSCDTQIDQI